MGLRRGAAGIVCLFVLASGTKAVNAAPHEAPAGIEPAIHQAAEFLRRRVGANGRFEYRLNLNPAVEVKPRYNILRHCGTVYALACYEAEYPNEETRRCIRRALEYLDDQAISPLELDERLLAVWSRPSENGSGRPLQAKLGGAGLALVAILKSKQVGVSVVDEERLLSLGDFILFMQKRDGGFYSKYIPERGGRCDRWTSLYYPGEAALGLALLYEMDPQEKWLAGASRSLRFLARARAGRRKVEADHWALLATQQLLATTPLPISDEQLLGHALQIAESILDEQPSFPTDSPLRGAFTMDGRTCPAATRLEGLLAARGCETGNAEFRQRLTTAIDSGIGFLLRAQLASGPYRGGVPRALSRLATGHPDFTPAFNRRATEIRIDYVQHALCALLAYHHSGRQ